MRDILSQLNEISNDNDDSNNTNDKKNPRKKWKENEGGRGQKRSHAYQKKWEIHTRKQEQAETTRYPECIFCRGPTQSKR